MISYFENPLLLMLGLGFGVQGFRCFPWMGVNFFFQEDVSLSTQNLLLTSANIPMIGKPIYGVISDALYIRGQHRLPYIAFGVFLQAISWLFLSFVPYNSINVVGIFLFVSNLGAAIAEVINEALVAEAGRRMIYFTTGYLQSFSWMVASVGGILGNLIGGIVIIYFPPTITFISFFFILLVQFLATVSVREQSLRLPRNRNQLGLRKQIYDVKSALRNPSIFYSIIWFAVSSAVIPILSGTMFFYQTQIVKLDSSIIGLSKMCGQAATLGWSIAYNKWLTNISIRKLIFFLQISTAIFMISDVPFVLGFYRKMGISDAAYVIVASGVLEVMLQFKMLPFSILLAQLCPRGSEGSLMAFMAATVALSSVISGYLGNVLTSFVGVSGNDFSGFPKGILIQALCTVVPLFWVSWVSDGIAKSKKND